MSVPLALDQTRPRQNFVLLLCVWLLSLTSSFAFQPSGALAQHNLHHSEDIQKSKQHPNSYAPTGLQSTLPKANRRQFPIFLASAGDEGVADSDLPMAVSLIGATTSAFVAGTFYLVLAWQRDALMVAFFLGSITNGVVSKILKRVINQSRPPDLATAEMSLKPSDGGMPSSHAMSLGFIGTFTAIHVSWTPIPIIIYMVISLWYRVRVKLHTTAQVLVGAMVGSANALMFNAFIKDGLMEWLRHHILDSNGLLPIPLLVVPAVVGAILVGSVERRISHWLEKRKLKAT